MVLSNPAALKPRENASALAVEQAGDALRSGDPAEAERVLRAHLLSSPADGSALAKLAELLRDQGRVREAILLHRRTLQADPAQHGVRLGLARMLHAQGEFEQALDQVNQLPPAIRTNDDVRALEAAILGLLGRHEPEIAIYEALVRSRRDAPRLWNSLGNALKYAGRTEEAVKALRQSVAARPGYGDGWWSLANVKTVRFTPSELSLMRKALSRKSKAEDALHLHFALGKALEDRNEYEASFRHYAEGNRIRAASFTPEQMRATAFVDNAIASFDETVFDPSAE